MRLYLTLSPSNETVPFDYQHYLTGAFHKWLGINELHDSISLYSFSWLSDSQLIKNGFAFPDGSKWFISSWDINILKKLVQGIIAYPEVCCGMKVTNIELTEDPEFGNMCRFILASPVLIRKYENNKSDHLIYSDPDADFYLTEVLKTKLNKAGLKLSADVSFDHSFNNPKTKLITINGIKNRTSYCPVIIQGDPQAIKFAWNVGIGHSTGCGFGAVCC